MKNKSNGSIKVGNKAKKNSKKTQETISLDQADLEILSGEELDFVVGGGGSRPRALAV